MGKKAKKIKGPRIIQIKGDPSLRNHPSFMRKHLQTLEFLKKAGLPKSFTDEHGIPDFLKEKE